MGGRGRDSKDKWPHLIANRPLKTHPEGTNCNFLGINGQNIVDNDTIAPKQNRHR